MSKILLRLILVVALALFSSNSFAGILDQVLFGAKAEPKYESLPPAKVYSKEEFEALANNPKLIELRRQYHEDSIRSEDEIIDDFKKRAGKTGAEGLYVLSSKARQMSQNGKIYSALDIRAETFRLEEPTLEKIKFILEKRAERFADRIVASDLYVKSIMYHVVANKYSELGDYILSLVIDSKQYKPSEKILMLDGYKALLGDKAIDGIKKVKDDRYVPSEVKNHAIALLTGKVVKENRISDDNLYKLIVTSSNDEADLLINDYIKDATPNKTEKLRKLMKNHNSEKVRIVAGKTLIKLHDNDFIEKALQTEKSEVVVTAIKKELLLQ
jgi:hypothetical protein